MVKIPYLKPRPNWGRIKYSDSFLYEMKHWNQTIRHNFETNTITLFQYLDNGDLTTPTKVITREYAIDIIKSYVLWMNRRNEYAFFKLTSSNQQH